MLTKRISYNGDSILRSVLSTDIEKLRVMLSLHSLRFQVAQNNLNLKNRERRLMRRRKMRKPQKLPTKLKRAIKILIVS